MEHNSKGKVHFSGPQAFITTNRKRRKRKVSAAGSAKKRKAQRQRSHTLRKAENSWDVVREELARQKKEKKSQMARQRNDLRKAKQASDCLAIHFEGGKNLSWNVQARRKLSRHFGSNNQHHEDIKKNQEISTVQTPMYCEDSMPFGGCDDF